MSDRTKKIISLIILFSIAIAGAWALWWFFFRPVFSPVVPPTTTKPPLNQGTGLTPAPEANRQPTQEQGQTPITQSPSQIANGGLTNAQSISEDPILDPFLSKDNNNVQYYNRADGKFYRLLPDGTIQLLSDKTFYNVSAVSWAPKNNEAILEYPDGSNILYNFTSKEQVTLPKHWQNFDFAPNADKVAFLSMGIDQDSRWLAIASPDGSGTKPVEPLGNNASKVQVAWSPNNQIIGFSQTGEALSVGEQAILPIGVYGENFRSLVVNGLGFRAQWSPDGAHIIYNVSTQENSWKPKIWIVDATPETMGAEKRPLDLNTWADKCAFGSATALYCAVPKTLQTGAGLYPAAAATTPDELWKVDLVTGQKRLLATPNNDYTIGNILISSDGKYLYFTDKISGQLLKINLK